MTNPNDAVGTNAAYGGRTSVNAFNDNLSAYSRGIMSGWACVPNSGLTVSLGGNGTTRDVAVAQDNVGNKTTINNTTGSPIDVTISAAPASNSRIDAIVGYVDNPPSGSNSVADNPSACGIIAVKGTAAASPTAPDDATIRTAITADGASGSTAYYAVLANITIASGTTTLTSSNINNGAASTLAVRNLDFANLVFGNYSTSEVDTGFTWIDGSKIYKKTFQNTFSGSENSLATGVSNLDLLIDWRNTVVLGANRQYIVGFRSGGTGDPSYTMLAVQYNKNDNQLKFEFGSQYTGTKTIYTTIWYTKSS